MKISIASALLALSACIAHASSVAPIEGPQREPNRAVYAVVHVDIDPDTLHAALPLLRSFLADAKKDGALANVDLLEQAGAENHFTLVEVLPSTQAYNAFVERHYVKTLRSRLQPLLGAPFDERLHHVMAMQ
ncbi:hypothetical protein QCE47_16575 [Caballeronia sp. LZ025]|uniref:putative quinol monooxygenase n=1 Tax=Caballeronia TaxID=1827195 RepID=UPI001FD109A5|nr:MULTISPECIES: hypothetical protein [Caballeronia]MDR5733937.1 hypothetical protein [Caballeronia sp. LZ025]